jgi:Fe-S-cluster containining protein
MLHALGTFWLIEGNKAAQAKLDSRKDSEGRAYPFEAVGPDLSVPHVDAETQQPYAYWLFSCPKLGPDGRCTIYADRLDTCRMYEAGEDELCALHAGFVPPEERK